MKSLTALSAMASKGSAKIPVARKSRSKAVEPQVVDAETFAAKYKTKLLLDECGDPIIPGTNGHLYFDDGRLCWMKLGPVEHLVKAKNLLASEVRMFWVGDGGDLDVREIPPDLWEKTMDLAGVKYRRTRKRKK